MAHRLLRNNGFAPAWIEEGGEIDAEMRRSRADPAGCDPAERRSRIDRLHRRIAVYNLKGPVSAAQKPPFRYEE
jgi:hypothetical protein